MTIPLPPLPRVNPQIMYDAEQVQNMMRAAQREAMRVALDAAARVLTEHQIPVGNSRAGEMARDWTYDALKECRDAIRNLEIGT